jgi:hypothetical protein
MKTLSLLSCSLMVACGLASCDYGQPYGYSSVGYSSPRYVTTYPSYAAPTYYPTGYTSYGSPYYSTAYPTYYPSTRYMMPVTTQTYVSGYPQSRYMSVGGYGYVPPVPRPDPWPLR